MVIKEMKNLGIVAETSIMKEAMLSSHWDEISKCVVRGSNITRERAIAAVSLCKRKFKVDDIVLMVLLDELEEVDFDQDSVIVRTTDDKKVELHCGGDIEDKYSRYMYNYIMDLKEVKICQ